MLMDLLAVNGAALPKENLKLLLNGEATLAAIDIGLIGCYK